MLNPSSVISIGTRKPWGGNSPSTQRNTDYLGQSYLERLGSL